LRSLFSGLVPLFALAHCAHHLVTALTVPLLPFIRDEFALDYTRAGFVISAFGVVYGISQLPAGWLGDRIEPRTLVTISICGVAVAGILVGLSQSYLMLLIFLVLMGILGGGYHPASTTMISATVAPKNRGQALGIHMMGGSVSYFLAPLIAAALAATLGWRSPFIIMAMPTIALGIVLYILLGHHVPVKETRPAAPGHYVETPAAPGHLQRLVTLLILGTFTQAVVISTASFVPLFLVDNFSISKETAAASMSLIYAVGLLAGPLGGYLSDHLGRVSIILTVCFISGPVIYLLNLVPYGFGIGILLVLVGTTIYFNSTVVQAYIADQTSERRRSTILGIYFFGNMEGTGVLTPVIGYLIDRLGSYQSFTIIGAALFTVALISSIFLWISRD